MKCELSYLAEVLFYNVRRHYFQQLLSLAIGYVKEREGDNDLGLIFDSQNVNKAVIVLIIIN